MNDIDRDTVKVKVKVINLHIEYSNWNNIYLLFEQIMYDSLVMLAYYQFIYI